MKSWCSWKIPPASIKPFENVQHLLFSRITFVNESLTLALGNYADFHLSSCSKRGLTDDGLGHLSHYSFGTAMNANVQERREKIHLFK